MSWAQEDSELGGISATFCFSLLHRGCPQRPLFDGCKFYWRLHTVIGFLSGIVLNDFYLQILLCLKKKFPRAHFGKWPY